ncbi:MAG TPA: hypothetical protein VIR58_17635 [Acidimicrobiales bacterium]
MTAPAVEAADQDLRQSVAELALECDGKPLDGGSIGYADGLAEVQPTPSAALGNMLDLATTPWPQLPIRGYRQERRDQHRALLSFDVDARTRIAVVLVDGLTDYLDNEG